MTLVASLAFASGEARDANGKLLATAQGTWHLWSRHPGGKETLCPPGSIRMQGGSPPLRVGKVVAVGRNYAEHAAEMGMAGEPPVFFTIAAASATTVSVQSEKSTGTRMC